jgi:hypothetical protein
VYAGLDDKDQVFAWLEKDFEQRAILLPEITWRFTLTVSAVTRATPTSCAAWTSRRE